MTRKVDYSELDHIVLRQRALVRRIAILLLVSVFLVVLIIPAFFILNNRISQVDPSYTKIRFAALASGRPQIIERHVTRPENFDAFPTANRFIQYDCGQMAIEVGGLARFKEKNAPEYERFQNAIAFRRKWISYANYIVNAQDDGHYDSQILKGKVRSMAEKFLHLVSEPERFSENYGEIMAERNRQVTALKNIGINDSPDAGEKSRQENDPDPVWCAPSPSMDSLPDEDGVRQLVENTRYVHGITSALFDFAGGAAEQDIWVWRLAKGIAGQDDDINVNISLADALYDGGRGYDEIFRVTDTAADKVRANANKVQKQQATIGSGADKGEADAVDIAIRDSLRKRYDRAQALINLKRAYLWAEKSLSLPDVRFDDDASGIPWAQALEYSPKDLAKEESALACIDDSWDLRVKDTYAFVRLAFMAFNAKKDGVFPDSSEVREAREILEDLRNRIVNMSHTSKCIRPRDVEGWTRRISNHLALADAMQREMSPNFLPICRNQAFRAIR